MTNKSKIDGNKSSLPCPKKMTLESKSGYSKSLKEKCETSHINSKSGKIQKEKPQQNNSEVKKHKTSSGDKSSTVAYSFRIKESKTTTCNILPLPGNDDSKNVQQSATVSTSSVKNVETPFVVPDEEGNFKVTGFIGPLYKPSDKNKSSEGLKTKKVCTKTEKKRVPLAADCRADHLEKLEENVQLYGQTVIDSVLSQFYKELDEIESTPDALGNSELGCSDLALSQAATDKPDPVLVNLQDEHRSAQVSSSTLDYEGSQSLESSKCNIYSGSGWHNSMPLLQPSGQLTSSSWGTPVPSFRPEWQHPPPFAVPQGPSHSDLNPLFSSQSPSAVTHIPNVFCPPLVGPFYHAIHGYEDALCGSAWSCGQSFQNKQCNLQDPSTGSSTLQGPSPARNPEHTKYGSIWLDPTIRESGQETYSPDQHNHPEQHLKDTCPDFNSVNKKCDDGSVQDPKMYSENKTSHVIKNIQENGEELQPGATTSEESRVESNLHQNLEDECLSQSTGKNSSGKPNQEIFDLSGVKHQLEQTATEHKYPGHHHNKTDASSGMEDFAFTELGRPDCTYSVLENHEMCKVKSLMSDSPEKKDDPFQNDSGHHLMGDGIHFKISNEHENCEYLDHVKQNSPISNENRQRKFYAAGMFGYFEKNYMDECEVNPWMDSLNEDLRREKCLPHLTFELDDFSNLFGEDVRTNSPCFGIQSENHANEPNDVSSLENLQNDAEMHSTENGSSSHVGSDEKSCNIQCPEADNPDQTTQSSCEFDEEEEVKPWMESLASDVRREKCLQDMFFDSEIVIDTDILHCNSELLSGQNGLSINMESDKESCTVQCLAAHFSDHLKQNSTDCDEVDRLDKHKQLSGDFDENDTSDQLRQNSDFHESEVRPWMETLHSDLTREKALQIEMLETSKGSNFDSEHTGMDSLCFVTEHGGEEDCSSIQGQSADTSNLKQDKNNDDSSHKSDIQTDKCSQNEMHEPNKEISSENLQSASAEGSGTESPCFSLQSKAEESCAVQDPSTDHSDQPKQNNGDFDEEEIRPWMYSLIHELKKEKCMGIQSQIDDSAGTADLENECSDQPKLKSESPVLGMQDKVEESCIVQDPSTDCSDQPTENSSNLDQDEVRPWMFSLINELKNEKCLGIQSQTDDSPGIEDLENECSDQPRLKTESPLLSMQDKVEESCIVQDPSADCSDQPTKNSSNLDQDEVRPWMYSLIHELKNEKCLGIPSPTDDSPDVEDVENECCDQPILESESPAEENCIVQDPSDNNPDKPTEKSSSFDEDEVRPWMYSLIHELKSQKCFGVPNETDDSPDTEGLETKNSEQPELKSGFYSPGEGLWHHTWPFELWQEDMYHFLENHPGRYSRVNSLLFLIVHNLREKYLSQQACDARRGNSLHKQKNDPELCEDTSLKFTLHSPHGSSCSVEGVGDVSPDHQELGSSELLGLRHRDQIRPSASESRRDKTFSCQQNDSVPHSRENSPCYNTKKNDDDGNVEDGDNSFPERPRYKRSKIHQNRKRPWMETLSSELLLLSSLRNLHNDPELHYEDSSSCDISSPRDVEKRIQALLEKYVDEPSFYRDSRRHHVKLSDLESICGSSSTHLQSRRKRHCKDRSSIDDSCIIQHRRFDYLDHFNWDSNDLLKNDGRNEEEFVVSKARRRHSSADQSYPKYEREERSFSVHRRVIIFMRGVPGSGKSTLARSLIENTENGVVLSTDDYFFQGKDYKFDGKQLGNAHDWNQNRAKEAMEQGKYPIVIDNTNIEAWEMKPYVEMALERNYDVEFLEPDTWWKFDSDELEKRNTHQVPREKIAKMVERFNSEMSVDIVLNSVLPKFKTNPRPSPLKKRQGLSDTLNSNRDTDR